MEHICTYEEKRGLEPPPEGEGRFYCWLKPESEARSLLGNNFRMAGDCSYSFNNKKARLYSVILADGGIPEDERAQLQTKLNVCCAMHHNLLNYSLTPSTGGINNLKGKLRFDRQGRLSYAPNAWGHDRLDTFLYCLSRYFDEEDKLILSAATAANRGFLSAFLSTFSGIYDYCKRIYFLGDDDRDFVDALLSNGSRPIQTPTDLNRYMDLAINYWERKKRRLAQAA